MNRTSSGIAGVLLFVSVGAAVAAEFHVSTAGNDANPGTRNKPFATLQKAADRMAAGDTCIVHGGVYRQSARLHKSGREGQPIRFVAATGEHVVLDGADVLKAQWCPWRNGIYRTPCDARFEQLFVNGRMMVEARWPNAGFEDHWNRSKWADSAAGSRKDMLVCPDLKSTGIDWTGAMAVLNVAHQYKTWVRKVVAYDSQAGSFQYELGERLADGPDDGPTWADDKFYLFGKLDALDAPGEWFLDPQTQSLYLYPEKDVDPGKAAATYKARAFAFEADKADFVELSGFEFFATTFRFVNCNHCLVENCRLRFPTFSRVPGRESVVVTQISGSHNIVRHTSLAWSNVAGLAVLGDYNRIEDCIVHDVNWLGNYGYAGITITGGPENHVCRSSVSRMGNIGILYNGGKNEIAYNHVFDAGKACKDLAAVHTGGPACRGSEAHHNWIHRSSGIGLRGDDQARGLVVHHNVIWDCDLFGMIVKGDDNLVYHNTLVGGRGGVLAIPTLPEPKKWWTANPTLPVQNPNSRFVDNAFAVLWWQDKPLKDQSRLAGNQSSMQISHRWIGKVQITASNSAWFRNAKDLDFRPAADAPLIGKGTPITTGGTSTVPAGIDVGAYQGNEPYWVPGATWVDAQIDLPPEITAVAQRAATPGDGAFKVNGPFRDASGISAYSLASPCQRGPNQVQFLLPDRMEKEKRYPVLYILPVYAGGNARASGIHEAKRLNLHNLHGVICVAPTFDTIPWYADHPSDPQVRQERYLLDVVVPFVERTFPALREPRGRLLVGFSKSGWGAFSTLLRHPDVFGRAAAWDAPLMMQKLGPYEAPAVFATQENFDKYKITSLLGQRAGLLTKESARLALLGHGNFPDDEPLHARMMELKIPHYYDHGPKRKHAWDSGWLGPAVEVLFRPEIGQRPAKTGRAKELMERSDGRQREADDNCPLSSERPKEVLAATGAPHFVRAQRPKPPNVVVILTDDQGFGELGVTGNPLIHTPHIDRLAAQGVSLTNFHVMPVCSPTRACLMTGRYHYRTGVTDTYRGRSLMHPDETTVAEMFAAERYRTGIFGKWHLGDNYPMRAMDKGFQESLVLNGGGLADPGDAPDAADERGAYFNATLRHNGKWVRTKGYVSDVLTDAAIEFIEKNTDRPFFVYLPFNCPHSPHQVPDEYRRHYREEDFRSAKFPDRGHPMATKYDPDDLACVYGMIENIDDNVGRLLARLDQLKLADNTIVVLFSDNGCQKHNGYNAGFQGWKGTPLEGGIHQFCFLRWPAQLVAGRQVDRISAVIDLAPTLIDLCGVPKPDRVKFDGLSLAALVRGQSVAWADRVLFFQWHRGDAPERWRGFAARSQDWKLVQPLGTDEKWNGKTSFHLYDMARDPFELYDLAAQEPDCVATLKAQYDAWFTDVTAARDCAVPSRIFLGAPQENPVLLTRQDWRGSRADWGTHGVGYWEVNVVAPTRYEIKLRFRRLKTDGEATLSFGGAAVRQSVKPGETESVFRDVQLAKGLGRLEVCLKQGSELVAVEYIEVKKL